jgi:hypothetical protein
MGVQERKRPIGSPRHRWVDNIGMDLEEIAWAGIDWIDLAYDRALVNMVMNTLVPLNGGKFLSSCATGGFSRRSYLSIVSQLMIHKHPRK